MLLLIQYLMAQTGMQLELLFIYTHIVETNLFYFLTAAVTGTWSKMYSTGSNKWTDCGSRGGCEGSPNVSYCQNLARHEEREGANLVLYNPDTKHCCKFYCVNPYDKEVKSASSSNQGHELWFFTEKSKNQ